MKTGRFAKGSAQQQSSVALGRESLDAPWTVRALALLARIAVTSLAVVVCDWVLPGFQTDSPEGPITFAVLLGVVSLVMQPLMVGGAVLLGWAGVLLLAFVGQAAVVLVTAQLLPSVEVDGFVTALLVAVVVGLVGSVASWFSTAGTSQALVGRLVASARRRPAVVADPEVDGVVFVQLDGVPFPVLQMAITAGTVPTLTRWVRAGSHTLGEWTPKLPATTPASQMGILHGVIDGIPAFRWYDRAEDRVMVANKPRDAALIEESLTTGHGLLADGGASISNLFTGDAPVSALTMSRRAGADDTTRRAVAHFVLHPTGLTRAVSRSVSELARDRFQTRRAIHRDVRPRCERTWTTALLRCVTNGVLRDVNTVLVAQHMLGGTRSIYVDYVDYDEIAHHAGMLRPESLEALEAVDGVLHQLEMVARVAPRRYHFVVLSDHGQSQGATFSDRYDEELGALVARLASATVSSSESDIEGWGRTRALVDDLGAGSGMSARAMRNVSEAMDRDSRHQDAAPAGTPAVVPAPGLADRTFHVFGSGNLGLVYVRGEERQLTRQQLDERFPALVAGLAAHPGIAFAVVTDELEGPVALGSGGSRRLRDGLVRGTDPLLPFGERANDFVLRVATRPEAPDIYVNSLLEPGTEEVAAFEGLVGCHGGLGGWQERACLVVPAHLPWPDAPLVGADALHVALRDVLVHLGHRRQLSEADRGPGEPAPQAPVGTSG
ncbi:phage holin family protein [Nocardioides panacis]|uniref:Phage holin family protein n=1 Tax=Nocardioides panacis TaxID=2849501 RepID=A0A975SZE1_9ACTN|nr:phage holin family protein [Nocardioides panacis]QWZ08788.1 phage holin family protein [Nocardioides panacis]